MITPPGGAEFTNQRWDEVRQYTYRHPSTGIEVRVHFSREHRTVLTMDAVESRVAGQWKCETECGQIVRALDVEVFPPLHVVVVTPVGNYELQFAA